MSDVNNAELESHAEQPADAAGDGIGRHIWVRIVLITGLLAALFWPNLVRLWEKTNPITGDANWAHAVFVPLIGLYYLYLNREALRAAGRHVHGALRWRLIGGWAQLQLAVWGVVFFIRAYYPPSFYGSRRRLAFALALLGFAALTAVIGYVVYRLPQMRSRRLRDYSAGQSKDTLARRRVLSYAATDVQSSKLANFVELFAYRSATWFGLCLMIWGMVLFAWAIYPGRNFFLMDMGMIVTVFGTVLLLCGWGRMRVLWFPIVFLVAAIPWPELFYTRVALPLQQGAATAAVAALNLTGVDAERKGTIITIPQKDPNAKPRQLNVAEACAGLKSLMTFIAIAAAVAFLSSRFMWQKLVITASAVPIAVLANMVRVAGQGLLDHYVSQKLSESFAHQFVGLVMLVPALLLVFAVAWLVDRMVVEEVEKGELESSSRPKAGGLIIEIPRARRRELPAEAAATEPTAAAAATVCATTEAAPAAAGPVQSDAPQRPAPLDDLAAATQRLIALRQTRRSQGGGHGGEPSDASGSEEK